MQGSSQAITVNLQGSLGIDRAVEIKERLSRALASAARVTIDISSAEDIDLSCLQAFYAARAEAKACGKELRFEGTIPQRISKRLAACGFLRGPSEHAEDFEASLVDF
jgi:anti-anti-sigma regulatory factor